MKLIDAYARILELSQPVFRTDDISVHLNIKRTHASKLLNRLSESGHILHINRGLWAVKEKITITSLSKHITSPIPNYISLQSALYRHGIISQVPSVLYIVSPARQRIINVPAVGTISVHHIHPAFFFGCKKYSPEGVFVATPEKALVDFLYLRPAKSGLFRSLPEVELPETFSIRRAESIISRIPSLQRRSMVKKSFARFLE